MKTWEKNIRRVEPYVPGEQPTGLSESTPPGFFHVCMGRP